MKTQILKLTAILLIVAGSFYSCKGNEPQEQDSQISDLSFTPCKQTQQSKTRDNNELSDVVNVEFTSNGVHIMYYNFEVACDFNTVDVNYTFVNGFLNITQQGTPNEANCVCYTDVSYTINGISQNDVNVIFINGEQVYCYNNESDEDEDEDIEWCDCKEELFYYASQDKKIFLDELFRNNYLIVGFDKQVQYEEIVTYINQTDLFYPINVDMIHPSKDLFVYTKEQKTCSQLKEIILLLKSSPDVIFANFTFKYNKNDSISTKTYKNEFLVKLKETTSYAQMQELVDMNFCTITKEIGGEPFYLIQVSKESVLDALQMSNFFYETGLFESSQPSMWSFIYNPNHL